MKQLILSVFMTANVSDQTTDNKNKSTSVDLWESPEPSFPQLEITNDQSLPWPKKLVDKSTTSADIQFEAWYGDLEREAWYGF